MGILYDYFVAPNDESAAATIDFVDGRPRQPLEPELNDPGTWVTVPLDTDFSGMGNESIMSFLDELAEAQSVAQPSSAQPRGSDTQAPLPTLSLRGFDPYSSMAKLELLLAGRSYEDFASVRSTRQVADAEDGCLSVVALSDSIRAALAMLQDADLDTIGRRWMEPDPNFGMLGEPDEGVDVLGQLLKLARLADATGQSLYCRVIV